MKALLLSAGLLAAALSVSGTTVRAADLDYRGVPPPDRYGSAYEDPRYRDLYGPEPESRRAYSYDPVPQHRRHEDYRPVPVPPGYVYRDQYAERCLPRHVIKRQLVNDGWSEFHDLDANGRVARVRARRDNGDLFRLKVDRCTGEVLKAVLLERYDAGPYAHRRGPGTYDRRYY